MKKNIPARRSNSGNTQTVSWNPVVKVHRKQRGFQKSFRADQFDEGLIEIKLNK